MSEKKLSVIIFCSIVGEVFSTYYGKLSEIYPDHGEVVQLEFLTSLRSLDELVFRQYHIIDIPNLGQIHLHKDQHHFPEEGDESHHHSVFRGTFSTGSEGTAFFVTEAKEGEGQRDSTVGFHGHLITQGHHYIIEPLESHPATFSNGRIKRNVGANGTSIPHMIFKVNETITSRDNGTHADVLHVPKGELEKAFQEMENETSTGGDKMESTESISTEATSQAMNSEDENNSESNTDLTVVYATRSKKNKKKGKGSNKKVPQAVKTSHKIVELAVFTDQALYKIWKKRHPNDAKAKMKTFILNLINNMNILYTQPSLGDNLQFRLVHVEINTDDVSGLDSNDGEATKYLRSFCKYSGNKNQHGTMWDHSLLITGHDLKENGDKLVAGMAWYGTMCLKYYSCSINEGMSFAVSHVMTHELGHSLGMEHDGTGISKSCSSAKFIMSPTTGAGKTSWSSCSSKNLKNFVAKGSPEVQSEKSAPTCLGKIRSGQKNIAYTSGGKLPGEIFGTKAQCLLECGSNCEVYFKKEEEVCSMIKCKKPAGGGSWWVKDAHPALEGSSCGTGKICKFGKCVARAG